MQGTWRCTWPQVSLWRSLVSSLLTSVVFKRALARVGDYADDFYEAYREHRTREHLGPGMFLRDSFSELPQARSPSLCPGCLLKFPQIAFALRAVQYPASIPVSFGSLKLIQSTVSGFSHAIFELFDSFGSIADQLDSIRKLYEIRNIKNKVEDGSIPFPENKQEMRNGISVEFR